MSSAIVAAILCALAVIVAARPHDESKAQWTGKPWLGKWESTDKVENWEPFVKAANIEPKYQVVFPGTEQKREWDFKINQEGTYSHDGTELKYKYTENGDQLEVQLNTPSKNTEMKHTYKVNGDELEQTFTSSGVTGKKWYKKIHA